MKTVQLLRGRSTDQGTFGEARIDGELGDWNSLELPWRNNQPQYSCIPPGTYRCALAPTGKWSPRPDGLLFQVLAVPGRDQVKIHAATWAGDVTQGWHSDLRGCIALGKSVGHLTPPEVGRAQAALLLSRAGLTEFMQAIGADPFDLVIQWRTAP